MGMSRNPTSFRAPICYHFSLPPKCLPTLLPTTMRAKKNTTDVDHLVSLNSTDKDDEPPDDARAAGGRLVERHHIAQESNGSSSD